ncbi:MAG: c-type cytochrome domain-containing protein [Armatimonadota bacterium]
MPASVSILASAVVLSWLSHTLPQQKPTTPPPAPSYQKDIVPILRTACIGCHGNTQPAAGFSVASYDDLFKAGKKGPQLVAGKAAQSRLVRLVLGTEQPRMPPGAGLKSADAELIRRWVDAGAKRDIAAVTPASAAPKVPTSKPAGAPAVVAPASIGPVVANGSPVTAIAFSPDAKLVAIGTYARVLIVDTATGKSITAWKGHGDTVRSLCFTPDGKKIIAGGGVSGAIGQVRVWDVSASKEILVFGDHTDIVNQAAISPNATTIVTASSDKTLKVWELASGKLLQTLRDHADQVLGVAYQSSGKHIVSCSLDKSFKTWDTTSWKRLYSVPAHDDGIYDVDMTPSGNQIYTTGADRRVRVWNFGTEGAGHVRDFGLSQAGWGAAIAGQNPVLVTGDTHIRAWRISDGAALIDIDLASDVMSTAISNDTLLAAAGLWNGDVVIVDVTSKTKKLTISTKGVGL